ncbi:hypothetical protein BC938DRAFT_472130 [Jimgerdemannia flammicorona]|uniref:Uncharacterized protein n=1 Tax=Jimgerdemannia flammicorona TaxID=994334 RepID=A0A433Q6Q5_9FUNG|nr:hypothetical protein BC938DRAFT_472130 [Jimgerdemannia flammicorona]
MHFAPSRRAILIVLPRPLHDGYVRGVDHANDAKDYEQDVDCLLVPGASDSFKMEERREKPVQSTEIARTRDRDHGAYENGAEPENVLLPLHQRVVLAGLGEQPVLHDADGREQLQRDRQADSERVQRLDAINEQVARGEVQ